MEFMTCAVFMLIAFALMMALIARAERRQRSGGYDANGVYHGGNTSDFDGGSGGGDFDGGGGGGGGADGGGGGC